MRLYADGWYLQREMAEDSLELIAELGGTPLALLEYPEKWHGCGWGIVYCAEQCLFENHRLDWSNALFAELRRRRA
jgi:hypothetical protein